MVKSKISRVAPAFSLIEVIMGITVLTLVITAIGVLAITSIRANQGNINRLTAYYLAQEGVEGFRNMRDSNWLQNHAWNKGANFGAAIDGWGVNFDEEGYYRIDYLADAQKADPAPWSLSYLGGLSEDSGAGSTVRAQSLLEGTVYGRYVELRQNEAHSDDWMEVTAVVFWQDHGREQEVRVSGELTDWREGPL